MVKRRAHAPRRSSSTARPEVCEHADAAARAAVAASDRGGGRLLMLLLADGRPAVGGYGDHARSECRLGLRPTPQRARRAPIRLHGESEAQSRRTLRCDACRSGITTASCFRACSLRCHPAATIGRASVPSTACANGLIDPALARAGDRDRAVAPIPAAAVRARRRTRMTGHRDGFAGTRPLSRLHRRPRTRFLRT